MCEVSLINKMTETLEAWSYLPDFQSLVIEAAMGNTLLQWNHLEDFEELITVVNDLLNN
jgi:hypothetical protein